MLRAISPIDGRYASKTSALNAYFSEFALIKYRVFIEVEYFIQLVHSGIPGLEAFPKAKEADIRAIFEQFSDEDAQHIKKIESTTNHDVKAVEYFLKEKFDFLGLQDFKEFIHFGLTSQDINNTAVPLGLKDALQTEIIPAFQTLVEALQAKAEAWRAIPMLAHTHGQPASPTLLGKEIQVFVERLNIQLTSLQTATHGGKFGGATGNFNAHYVVFPDINWHDFGNQFLERIGLQRQQWTTQIEHYDGMAAIFDNLSRLNTILVDLCRDMWTYISMEYFRQKTIAGEVGSSAMPHKVNPIDFENAEGNLGVANALFSHFSQKLPISRLQRDLTDSTVLRNIGVPCGHTIIALQSISKGLGKLLLNQQALDADLEANWMVLAEPIQNLLRAINYPEPYEQLKALTRGKAKITQADLIAFIDTLDIPPHLKDRMKSLSPHNYTGPVR